MEIVSREAAEAVRAAPGVTLTQLTAGEHTNLQTFRVAPGETVPEHSHPHEQAGYVLEGSGVFLVDGDELFVSAGDAYLIPGDQPHALENRGEEPLAGVDVFSPPRDDADWAE